VAAAASAIPVAAVAAVTIGSSAAAGAAAAVNNWRRDSGRPLSAEEDKFDCSGHEPLRYCVEVVRGHFVPLSNRV